MQIPPRTAVSAFSIREQLGPIVLDFRDAEGVARTYTLDNPQLLSVCDFPRRALDELGVELVEVPGFYFSGPDDPELGRFDKALAETGVGLLNVVIDSGDLLAPDDDLRAGDLALLKRWVTRAATMGSEFVRVNPGSPFTRSSGGPPAHLVAALAELGEHAQAAGTRLLVENHSGPSSDPTWMAALLDEVSAERCGLLLDLGNLEPLMSGIRQLASEFTGNPEDFDLQRALTKFDLEPLYSAVETLAPRADVVSVKVNFVADDGAVGAVDLHRAMRILVGAGFDGPLSVEYEGFAGDPWAKTKRVVDVAQEADAAAQELA